MGSAVLGKSITRPDSQAKVLGTCKYPQDFQMPGQLYGAIVWSAFPHARITRIDTVSVERLPGVVRVLTHRDVPVNEYGILEYDQPVLVPEGGTARWLGDRIAIVVAETEQIARQAAAMVRVDYETLPVVDDPRAARLGAPLVQESRGTNILAHIPVRKGDWETGFSQADVIIEATYETQTVEHAYLQPEAGLGYIDSEGRITIVAAAQWPHDDVRQIAHMLDLPPDRIHEVVPAVGGAFGGREDMYIQHLLALCAYVLKQPVKIVFSREESMRCTGKRHPFFMRYRYGATRAGRLVAADIEVVSDAGAYASTSWLVLGCAVGALAGPYSIPNARIDAYAVLTNNAIGMAMRGFGSTQAPVAYEQHMDRVAAALAMDPVEFRLKNMLVAGSQTVLGNRMPAGTSPSETLRTAALAAGWTEKSDGHWERPALAVPTSSRKRVGIGIGSALKNVGFPFGFDDKATVVLEARISPSGTIDHVDLSIGAVDVGQGVHTILRQFAAEALDLNPSLIDVLLVDTADVPDAGSASASRLTYIAGNAVIEACRIAREEWHQMLREEKIQEKVTVECTYHALQKRPTTNFDPETGQCDPFYSYSFGTQIALIEVDVDTGEIDIIRVWAATDAGRVINPQMTFGQVAGGIQMGLGYALMEDYVQKEGRALSRRFSEYYIPSIRDIPCELSNHSVEVPDPTGPFGAKGLGEITTASIAPAILNAIHDAVRVRVSSLPATSEKVWRAMCM